MSASITEALMAQGAVALEFEPDPDLFAELVKGPNGEQRDGRGLIIYWAEYPEPFGCIKVGDVPSKDGIVVNAVGLEWLLGNANGDIGPTDVDRVYVAGNNKLANPVFQYTFTEASTDEFGNPVTRVTGDSWKLAEKTGWVIAVGSATVTNALRAALVDLDANLSLPSDILTSDESFECLAGDELRSTVTASRASGSIGRLRNRLVFEGHFRHPNILAPFSSWTIDPGNVVGDATIHTSDPKSVQIGPVTRQTRLLNTGWTDTSSTPGDTVDVGTWLTIGPCTQPQYIADPQFSTGDFTNWTGNEGNGLDGHARWSIIGSFSAGGSTINPEAGSFMAESSVTTTSDTYERWLGPRTGPSVKVGERYRLNGFVIELSLSKGSATLLLQPVPLSGTANNIHAAAVVASNFTTYDGFRLSWKQVQVEYTVADGIIALQPWLYSVGQLQDDGTPYGARYLFSNVTLSRIKGNTCSSKVTSFSVVPQDTYEIVSQAFANSGMTDGEVVMAVTMTGSGKPDITVKSNPVLPANTSLIRMTAIITPDDGYTDAYVTFIGTDVTGDSVVCNYPVVTRTVGNTAKVDAPSVSVVPEESYTFHALVTADASVTQGTIGVQFTCSGAGRPDQVIDGPSFDASSITAQGLDFPFATPSGYDSIALDLVGTDILGGKFTVGPPTFSRTDPKRYAVDAVSGASLGTQNTTLNVRTPIGADHYHLQLVAEDKADDFVVTQASVARAETPWTSGAVANDLLKDPTTGVQLVQPGNIVGTETIAFDWHVKNLTQRAKLQHLSRAGLAVPVREWRFYLGSTGKPTMDWGLDTDIFADRTDLVFVNNGGDLKLLGLPSKEHSSESRVTQVTVVGADRERPDNVPLQITGSATNDNSDFLDWNGNPLNRTQTVTDSSANHTDYAAALARYKADLVAVPPENIQLTVPDLRAWLEKGPAHVGDWVYLEDLDAGIYDLSNPVQHEGATVFPKKLRVISRTRKLGQGDFKVFVHRPGLDDYEVTDFVRWEPETSEQLELGNPLPEFNPDNEGGPALDQLRRFRASMPTR